MCEGINVNHDCSMPVLTLDPPVRVRFFPPSHVLQDLEERPRYTKPMPTRSPSSPAHRSSDEGDILSMFPSSTARYASCPP